MKETIKNLKAIMADKHECKEFIGSILCTVVMLVLAYIAILIFH